MVLSIFKPGRDNERDVISFLCRKKPCPISLAEKRHKITGTNKLLLHHDKWVRNRHFIKLHTAWMNDESSLKHYMHLYIQYITNITHLKYAIKLHYGNQHGEFDKWWNIRAELLHSYSGWQAHGHFLNCKSNVITVVLH